MSPRDPVDRPTPETVLSLLEDVIDPCSVATGTPLSLSDMGLIDRIDVSGSEVVVWMRLSSPGCYMLGFFTDEITARLRDVAGERPVKVAFDNGLNWESSLMRESTRGARRMQFAEVDRRARNARSQGVDIASPTVKPRAG